MRTRRIKLPNWPFMEDEKLTIHWIASPIIDRSGAKSCKVFFRNERDEIHSISVPWGLLSELWIGRRFVNAEPCLDEPRTNSVSLITNYAQNTGFGDAVKMIPLRLYPLRVPSLFNEWCHRYKYDGYTYIIPSIEIARVFLARDSALSNQLLSSSGIDEYIDLSSWKVEGKKVYFDFLPSTPSYKREFAGIIATLYGMPEMTNAWYYTHTQYVSAQLIKTYLPMQANVTLHYREVEGCNDRFVESIQVNKIYRPFEQIDYGPEKLVHSRNRAEENGSITSQFPTDDGPLEARGELSRRSHISVDGSSARGGYLDGLAIKRQKVKDDTTANIKVIEQPDSDITFSVGDISGAGEFPFINIEMNNVPLDNDPDFTAFCKAIEMLQYYADISVTDISYADLPQGKRFSLLNLLPKRPRRYICVSLQKGTSTWIIIELCNKDGYSISTLITECPDNKEELVNRIIDKLMISNGSWSRIHFPKHEYKTLDHHEYRSAERWAELMYYKMY